MALLLITSSASARTRIALGPGGARVPTAVDPQDPTTAMGAWNGTKLLTAQVDTNGNLYAYAQTPGSPSWTREKVETAAANGGLDFFEPWIVATNTAVQIVAIDARGNIYFWQQADGASTWSAPQLVANVGFTNITFVAPRIAWTGVPGHPGTNSVITDADAAGNVLFFFQNSSGGWTPETVAKASAQNAYYAPAVTATNTGIVIVAYGTDGGFFSFFQPYGSSAPWKADGNVGVKAGQAFTGVSVTWDGVNVDVVAPFNDTPGASNPDKLMFLWKANSAQFWSHINIVGPSSTQPLASPPAIYRTANNLIVTAVQHQTSATERLDFWWQGTTFTNFHFETVATTSSPSAYGPPTLVSTTGSTGEVAILAPFNTGDAGWGLDDWTQSIGSPLPFTPHTVIQP
jgi:hypothetical protein